jgi:cyclopropane fatty-acyl-phospholipid synthase-like methyltransferase
MDAINNPILMKNKNSWDAMADLWFGTTALPEYGCFIPSENDLHLFSDNMADKKVLDIGCGSGHSLEWCYSRGAKELWGLDLSERQIENAQKYLKDKGCEAKLIASPMEVECGIPKDYFDVVYSIYALGWSTALPETMKLLASYLKKDGLMIFSWDHPIMHCIEAQGENLIFSGQYLTDETFEYKQKRKYPVTVQNHKMSTWINALASAGLMVEYLVEESKPEILERVHEFNSEYYSEYRASKMPLSFIIKARKI